MDVSNNNMPAPLLAKTFGTLPFALISAVAFTTVLGTVSGLIVAIPAMIAYAYFRGRTSRIISNLESTSANLTSLLSLER